MTDAEYLKEQARLRGRATQELMAEGVVLPCACTQHYCRGWRLVARSAESIDLHMRLVHPRPLPSVTAADYVERERRRQSRPYFYFPTNEGPVSER